MKIKNSSPWFQNRSFWNLIVNVIRVRVHIIYAHILFPMNFVDPAALMAKWLTGQTAVLAV